MACLARLDLATNQTLLTGDRLTRALADLAAAEQTLAALRDQIAAHDCSAHTRQVLAENVRYRMADRVNSAIRGTGVHSIAKALARRRMLDLYEAELLLEDPAFVAREAEAVREAERRYGAGRGRSHVLQRAGN